METKEIVAKIVKNGGKEFKGIKVLSVNITPSETVEGLFRISLNTSKQLPFLQTLDDGTQKDTKSNIIISSNYAIIGILRNDEFAAPVIGELQINPKALEVILANATIDVVQEEVEPNKDYVNPFTTRDDSTPTQFEHKVRINHIVSIALSESAKVKLDRLSDKVLGLI